MKSTKSDYFTTRFTPHSARARVWFEVTRFVERDIPVKGTVLEIGPGYCDFINQVTATTKYAIDIDSAASEFATQDVTFKVGDCTKLDFLEDQSVDAVFASNLVEHLERDKILALLAELNRVLKPDGRFLMIQPNFRLCYANYFDDYTHVSIFSDISLSDLLSANGFDVLKCVPGLLPFSMKSKAPKHPLLVRLYLHSPIRPLAKQMYLVARPRV